MFSNKVYLVQVNVTYNDYIAYLPYAAGCIAAYAWNDSEINESYELSLKKLYFSKVLHLFVVYHAWMLFYNLLPFFDGELAWTYENIKLEIIFDTLEGIGIYHLWFIIWTFWNAICMVILSTCIYYCSCSY